MRIRTVTNKPHGEFEDLIKKTMQGLQVKRNGETAIVILRSSNLRTKKKGINRTVDSRNRKVISVNEHCVALLQVLEL
jgi:hypothetical protein